LLNKEQYLKYVRGLIQEAEKNLDIALVEELMEHKRHVDLDDDEDEMY
jgi:hypothetical protein